MNFDEACEIDYVSPNMRRQKGKEATMNHAAYVFDDAPSAVARYAHAHTCDGLVYVTAMVGRDPANGDMVKGGFAPQFSQAITNLDLILRHFDSDLSDVVQTQIQYINPTDLAEMETIYHQRFGDTVPARTSFGVAFLGSPDVVVQIDCVAIDQSSGKPVR